MTGFEHGSLAIGSDRAVNCAAITAFVYEGIHVILP